MTLFRTLLLCVCLLAVACSGDTTTATDEAATAEPGATTGATATETAGGATEATAPAATETAAPATEAPATSEPAGTEETVAAGGDCMTAAQEIVDAARTPLEIGDIAPVDLTAHAGASLWHIAPSLATGYAVTVAEGVQEAGAAAGFEVNVFDAQGQPNVMVEGVSQAVANGADAIVIHAISPEAVADPLAQAAAAGIPVLSVLNALDPAALPEGITATLDPDVDGLAEQQAAYALVDGGCEVNAVVFYASVFPILNQMNTAIQASLTELCPECTVSEQNLDLRTMSQELPAQTQQVLRADESITHAIATFDSAALFIVQGIDELGSEVSVIGANGNDANLDIIRAGGAQIADAAYPPGRYAGWQIVDQVGRLLAGEDAAQREFPVQMIDADNVGADNSIESVFPGLAGFEDEYRQAWGVS